MRKNFILLFKQHTILFMLFFFNFNLGTKSLVTVGEMYFNKEKLKINMDNVGRVGKDGSKKLLGYTSQIKIYLLINTNTSEKVKHQYLNIL